VPCYQFVGHRSQLLDWAVKREAIDQQDAAGSPSPTASSEFIPPLGTIDDQPKANPNGMIHWWQSHNLTSLDGLPAFSAALGIGFPFTTPFKHTANSKVYSTVIPKSMRTFKRGTNLLFETPRSIHLHDSNMKFPLLQSSIINIGRSQGPLKDNLSFMRSLLPCLLILICGFFLGSLYEHSHHSNQVQGSGNLFSHRVCS